VAGGAAGSASGCEACPRKSWTLKLLGGSWWIIPGIVFVG